jgi:hypothetical protein
MNWIKNEQARVVNKVMEDLKYSLYPELADEEVA